MRGNGNRGGYREGQDADREGLVSLGERLLQKNVTQQDDLLTLTERLIETYDSPFLPLTLKERAAHVVEKLACQNECVLDMVIENAECYMRHLKIDDAWPYFPSSVHVLLKINQEYKHRKVTSFLRRHPEFEGYQNV